ncbi:MAG: hypothetical protein ACJA0G_001664, partial [Kangiellaceae bacterium]
MKMTFVATLFIPLITVSMLFNSAEAFALGQYIQNQSVAQINTILYISAGIFGALIMLMLVQSFFKNRQIAKYKKVQVLNETLFDNL